MPNVESISISRTIVANSLRFYTVSSDWWVTLVAVHVVTTCSLTLVSATTTPHTGIVSESAKLMVELTHCWTSRMYTWLGNRQCCCPPPYRTALCKSTMVKEWPILAGGGVPVVCGDDQVPGRRAINRCKYHCIQCQWDIREHSQPSMYLSHTFVWTYMYPPSIIMSTSSVSGAISLISTSYKESYFALPSG